MEKYKIASMFVFAILMSLRDASSKESQSACNVTRECITWRRNECRKQDPMVMSTTLGLLQPSPGLANQTYVICPVVLKWNITEETLNVTALVKEVKLFLDWLCKSPCNDSTVAVKRSCVDDKLMEYGNSSSMKNMSVIERDQQGFRLSIEREMHRLHKIANQPLNFDEIKQGINKLAHGMGIQFKENNETGHPTSKNDIIFHINNFTSQFNKKMNSSIAHLQLTASNFEIKLVVDQLERIGASVEQQPLITESLSSMYLYPTTDVSLEIQPTPKFTEIATSFPENPVYPSSCFVQKSHCFMKTECPNYLVSPTASQRHSSMPFAYSVMSSAVPASEYGKMNSLKPTTSYLTSTALYPSPTISIPQDHCNYDCAGTCNGTKTFDCQKICGGNATVDDCGQCTGGTTGKRRNYLKDCAGVCNGRSLLDSCNVCEQPSSSGGNRSRHQDCNNVCFGSAVLDRCDKCVGGNTGRMPAIPDACGVYCNGDNSTCSGCDNVPNSGKVVDACGICGGTGTTCVTITRIVPNVVPTTGRNVTVLGAGLNGTLVECVIGSTTVTGFILNITSVICPLPSQSANTLSMQVRLTKSGQVHVLGPLNIHYYDATSLSYGSLLPNKQMKGSIEDVMIHGSGFLQTNMSTCRIYNSSMGNVKATFINQTTFMCHLPKTIKAGGYRVSLFLNGELSLTLEKSNGFQLEIFAEPPKILNAKFSDSGSQIIVSFTSLRPLITVSDVIFASNVSTSLGLSPKLTWIGNTELRITTGQNASILPGHFLVLKENVFYSMEYSQPASGSVVVKGPDTPLLPSPVLKGPAMVSSCSDLKLSAAQSTGSGGRPLTFKWSVSSSGNIVQIRNRLQASSSDTVVIPSSDIAANKDYTFSVSVSNFLHSVPITVELTIRKSSSPIPELSVVPSSNPDKVLIASDFFLTAVVGVSSCSSNFTAGYTWSSADSTLSRSSSFKTTEAKQTLMIGKGTLVAGKTYGVNLRAYWKHDTSIASETSITLKTMLRHLVAVIKGGDFSVGSDAGNFMLDAKSLSYDPDNVANSFTFTWKCVDKETNGNCISLATKQPLAIASEGVILINPIHLKQRSFEFTVNVTSFSTSRWKTAKATVTIKSGTIPIVIINPVSSNVKPNSKLSIKATVIVKSQSIALWTTDVSSPGSSSIDFSDAKNFITQPTFIFDASSNSSAFFVVKQGVLQPGAKYTMRLTVKDGTKEGFGQISFQVYNTPTPGEFVVTPKVVEALNDISMTAPLWTMSSDCLPLKYEFGNYEQGNRFTSYGLMSDPSLTIPASLGQGSSHQLPLAVRVHSNCGTMTEKMLNITSTPPANLTESAVNAGIDKAAKAAASGDLSSAVASLDSLLGVAAGGESAVLKKVELQTLSTVLSLSESLPKTGSVSSSLLGVLKKVDPNNLNTTADMQSISKAYEKVLSGLKSTAIDNNDVETILDRLADIDMKSASNNVSESVLRSDESLAASLTSKTGQGQPPFETTGKKKRVMIKVAYEMFDTTVTTTSSADAVQIDFGKELKDRYKNWKCANGRSCEGVFLKMRSYPTSPLSLNDSRLVSSGTQVVDISLSDPISGEDIPITSLTTPISFNMTIKPEPGHDVKCVYYNKAAKVWEDQGMTTIKSLESIVKCQSIHLTSFAVIKVPAISTTNVQPTSSLSFDQFIASFTLAIEVWNTSLSNSSSTDSQALKATVNNWVNSIFNSNVNYNGASSIDFSLAPVNKVKVTISLLFKSGTMTQENIVSKLKTGSGSNGFHIDVNSLSVEKVQTSSPPTSATTLPKGSSAVLLATIFGILGAILIVIVVVLVLKSVYNKSKVHSQASVETVSP